MVVQIIDSADCIAYMSDLHPSDIRSGVRVADVLGEPIWKWVEHGAAEYSKALDRCRKTGKRQRCTFAVHVAGHRHRWFARLDRFDSFVIVLANNLPCMIDNLSERENEVMHFLAQHNSSSQIAKQLEITISTVEKHRSKIRQVLGLKDEQALLRAAETLAETHYFFDSNPICR